MRLYTVIGNDLFLKEVILNNAINASIKPSDYPDDSENTNLCYYLDRFLYYTNRENWDNEAISCYTSPSSFIRDKDLSKRLVLSKTQNKESYKIYESLYDFDKVLINNDEIVIAFDVPDKDVLLLDYLKYMNYTYNYDKVENNMVKSETIAKQLEKYFENVEQHVLDVKDFYNAIAFVREIPCESIKVAYVKRENPIVPLLQMSKSELCRKIPMQFVGKGIGKVRELLKHKPQNANVENKKFLITASENDREK